jgi:hypothetical protein
VCLTPAAAKKGVAAVTVDSARVVTSPSPPVPPAKHKQWRLQMDDPPGGMEEATEVLPLTIARLNGEWYHLRALGLGVATVLAPTTQHHLCCHCHLITPLLSKTYAALVIPTTSSIMISEGAKTV